MALEQVRSPAAERSFDEIVRQHKNRIYAYICRLTNDSPDAEDLAQEVFVRAFQSLRAFRHEAAVDTWLYRIATNLVIDRARRQRRAPQEVAIPEEERPGGAELRATARGSDPAGSAELTELAEQVRRAIRSLPLKFRLAAVLCELEGFSYEEASRALGCPLGTLKSRLYHARALLRERLREYVEGE